MLELIAIATASALIVLLAQPKDRQIEHNTYRESKPDRLHNIRRNLDNMTTAELDLYAKQNYLEEYNIYSKEYRIEKMMERIEYRG